MFGSHDKINMKLVELETRLRTMENTGREIDNPKIQFLFEKIKGLETRTGALENKIKEMNKRGRPKHDGHGQSGTIKIEKPG